jgi:hypothetical protein
MQDSTAWFRFALALMGAMLTGMTGKVSKEMSAGVAPIACREN